MGNSLITHPQRNQTAVICCIEHLTAGRYVNGVVENMATQVNLSPLRKHQRTIVAGSRICRYAERARLAQRNVHLVILTIDDCPSHCNRYAGVAAPASHVEGAFRINDYPIAGRSNIGVLPQCQRSFPHPDIATGLQIHGTVDDEFTSTHLLKLESSSELLFQNKLSIFSHLKLQAITPS